jgi:hypothetical protein
MDMYQDKAEDLFDGIFVDAGAFYPVGAPGFTNVSVARYRPVIDDMLTGLAWIQTQLTKLNGRIHLHSYFIHLHSHAHTCTNTTRRDDYRQRRTGRHHLRSWQPS